MSAFKAFAFGVILLTLLTGAAGVSADSPTSWAPYLQGGRNPLPTQADIPLPLMPGAPSFTIPSSPSSAGSERAQFALGAPGTSYRYVQTIGVTDEPYPADAAHINAASGIFIDANDSLYVTEEEGFRLLKFNALGANQLILGHAGQPWGHDDYLGWVAEVVVAANGHIFALINPAVKEFDAAGNVIQTLPADLSGSGNDDYHFQGPLGIAMNSLGQLFVGDSDNHRIQVYDIDSGTGEITYNATIGVTGDPRSDNTGFHRPTRLAFDSQDRLYVMDSLNQRVQRCTESGGWSCATFFGETGVAGDDLTHLSIFAAGIGIRNDEVFLGDSMNFRVLKCTSAGVCSLFAGITGQPGSGNNKFAFPGDVAIDSSGGVYVSDYSNHRVQKFSNTGLYQKTYGVTGVPYQPDNVRINAPMGVAIAEDGGLLVAESRGSRLVKYNPAGQQVWTFGAAGVHTGDNTGFGTLEGNPAVDSQGRIYVADIWNHRVQIIDSEGNYLTTMGHAGNPGTGNDQFDGPTSAAINPANGDILIADTNNHRIQVFNSNRVYKTTLGVPGVAGSDNSHFDRPTGVAVNDSGEIFVADSQNFRLQKCTLSESSNPCTTFAGETGVFDDSFAHLMPRSVAIDGDERVIASDEWNQRVQVFDSSGAYLTTIGGNGGPIEGFSYPQGVIVDSEHNLYVADLWNHRVQKFALGVPGWSQMNLNGFGLRHNIHVGAIEVFQGKLFAGTYNESGTGAQLWQMAPDQTWNPMITNGFGSGNNTIIDDLLVYKDNLYAAVGNNVTGGNIYRSNDGSQWDQVVSDGFSDATNSGQMKLIEFDDMLYASIGGWDTGSGTEIWRSSTGDSQDWEQAVDNGFGDPNNYWAPGMVVFNDYLYAGTFNWITGAEVWRTDNGTTWLQVNVDRFGEGAANATIMGFASFNNALYAGTHSLGDGPGKIWRTTDGLDWAKVIGDGFGDPNNTAASPMGVFENKFYAMTENIQTGMEIWQTLDGDNWMQIHPDGFGDHNNVGTHWGRPFKVFRSSFYIFTANRANGGEIWKMDSSPVHLPLVRKQKP